jgi:hypothetical protein
MPNQGHLFFEKERSAPLASLTEGKVLSTILSPFKILMCRPQYFLKKRGGLSKMGRFKEMWVG